MKLTPETLVKLKERFGVDKDLWFERARPDGFGKKYRSLGLVFRESEGNKTSLSYYPVDPRELALLFSACKFLTLTECAILLYEICPRCKEDVFKGISGATIITKAINRTECPLCQFNPKEKTK